MKDFWDVRNMIQFLKEDMGGLLMFVCLICGGLIILIGWILG